MSEDTAEFKCPLTRRQVVRLASKHHGHEPMDTPDVICLECERMADSMLAMCPACAEANR